MKGDSLVLQKPCVSSLSHTVYTAKFQWALTEGLAGGGGGRLFRGEGE